MFLLRDYRGSTISLIPHVSFFCISVCVYRCLLTLFEIITSKSLRATREKLSADVLSGLLKKNNNKMIWLKLGADLHLSQLSG